MAADASNAFEAEDFWANVSVVFGAIESSVKAKPVGTAGDDAFLTCPAEFSQNNDMRLRCVSRVQRRGCVWKTLETWFVVRQDC